LAKHAIAATTEFNGEAAERQPLVPMSVNRDAVFRQIVGYAEQTAKMADRRFGRVHVNPYRLQS
jgi:hypothetical protein